jgi:CheY-like chemotaxis protein
MSRGEAGGRVRRVLVVEDGVDAAGALGDLLRLWGHEAWVAHDGTEGLDLVRRHGPDVVLLDIGLPGIDGYEVASRIRGEAAPDREILLVALTGYGQEKDVERALAGGFDHHLLKPIDPATLRELLGGPA